MSVGWIRESGRPNVYLHWAINGLRNRDRWSTNGYRRPDLGTYEVEVDGRDLYEVRVLRAPFPYLAPASCRIEREPDPATGDDGWHNRVHRSSIRIIAEGPAGRMEYGFGLCGTSIIDPIYLREGERTCSCGNGDGTPCPRCEAVGA